MRVREASRRGGKGPVFTPAQCEACVQFVDTFTHHLRNEAYLHATRPGSDSVGVLRSAEDLVLPFQEDVAALLEGLKGGTYASLPMFGKALRDTMQSIEAVLVRSRSFVQVRIAHAFRFPMHTLLFSWSFLCSWHSRCSAHPRTRRTQAQK